jgi:hypothetical protein
MTIENLTLNKIRVYMRGRYVHPKPLVLQSQQNGRELSESGVDSPVYAP